MCVLLAVKENNFNVFCTFLKALLTKLMLSHLSQECFQTTVNNALFKYNVVSYKIGHNYVE